MKVPKPKRKRNLEKERIGMRKYQKTDAFRIAREKYRKSDKGRATISAFVHSETQRQRRKIARGKLDQRPERKLAHAMRERVARLRMDSTSSGRTLKRLADRLCSALVILRDGHCVVCGSLGPDLQAGHFFGRIRHSVRWDTDNVAAQDSKCNFLHNSNPEPLRAATIQRIGQEGFDLLSLRARQLGHSPIGEIVGELKKQITNLPKWNCVEETLRRRIFQGRFTNKELVRAIHGEGM